MLPKQNFTFLALLCLLLLRGFTSIILAQGDAWITKAPVPQARAMGSACEINGIIYVIGGITPDSYPYAVSMVEAYDPETDTWTVKAGMPTARQGLATCCLIGNIYAIGGSYNPTTTGTTDVTIEEYDPITSHNNPSFFQSKLYFKQITKHLIF